ncbi:hypothetical protein [Armatimonas sp.]|uniref:hypothetical protein n=1 Tax=Armatimonas sp. TaxID=1872638 RepID=UPI00286AAAAC|nr:hypothetical protein [Armatimonas sp.]
MRRYTFLLPLAALCLLGCSPEKPAEPQTAPATTAPGETHSADDGHGHSATATTTTTDPHAAPKDPQAPEAPKAPAASDASMPGGPMAGAADPYAPLSKTPELDAKIAEAEKSGDKAALADAYVKRGMFRMRDDDKAGQRVKYRAALSDFRKALKIPGNNTDALVGKDQIESIYTGMGRPVPSEAEADEVSRTGVYKPKPGE